MGASQNSNFTQTLTFIQKIQDINFGQIQVYRNQDGKYIMKNEKTFITGDRRFIQFKRTLQFLNHTKNKNILMLQYLEQKHLSNVCIEYEQLSIYTEYLNFTLKGLIIHKKDIQISEIWYCLKCLLQLSHQLEAYSLKVDFSLDKIFLTLKGIPSIYLYHVKMKDQDVYIHNISDDNLQINEHSTLFNVYSTNYSLAKAVLQLALMEQLPEGQKDMQFQFIQKMLFKLSKKSPHLSDFIRNLMTMKSDIQDFILAIDLLIQKNIIKVSTQVRFNKFRYVLPEEQKQKQKQKINQKIRKLNLDTQKLQSMQQNNILNYNTPIYRLTQNNQSLIKGFFSSTSNQLKSNIQSVKQKTNKGSEDKKLIQNQRKQINTQFTPILRKRINSMSRNHQKNSIDPIIHQSNVYEPISIKPRKKTFSVASISRKTEISNNNQDLQMFQNNNNKPLHNNRQHNNQNIKQIIPINQNIKQTTSTNQNKKQTIYNNNNENKNMLEKSNILNLLKKKIQQTNHEPDKNRMKNNTSRGALDQLGFLQSLQLKKQQNLKKTSQMTLRKQQLKKILAKTSQMQKCIKNNVQLCITKNIEFSISNSQIIIKKSDQQQNKQNRLTRNKPSQSYKVKQSTLHGVKSTSFGNDYDQLSKRNNSKSIREFCKHKNYINSLKDSFIKKMV